MRTPLLGLLLQCKRLKCPRELSKPAVLASAAYSDRCEKEKVSSQRVGGA